MPTALCSNSQEPLRGQPPWCKASFSVGQPLSIASPARAMFSGAMGWLILLMLLAGIVWVGFKVLQPTDPHVGEATAD